MRIFHCYSVSIIMITVCNYPLGMEDGRIQDSQLTASSQYSDDLAPAYARLNQPAVEGGSGGAWHPKGSDTSKWIQVDLSIITMVTGIISQGRGRAANNQWTTKYNVQRSDNAALWMWVMGVNQQDALVRLMLRRRSFSDHFAFRSVD